MSFMTRVRLRDMTGDGGADLVVVGENGAELFVADAAGSFGRFQLTLFPDGDDLDDLIVDSFDGDGIGDVLGLVSGTGSAVVLRQQPHLGSAVLASGGAVDRSWAECAGLPSTMVCVAAGLARISPCSPRQTLVLEDGEELLFCPPDAMPIQVRASVRIMPRTEGGRGTIGCGSTLGLSTLFEVVESGVVELVRLDVEGVRGGGRAALVVGSEFATLSLSGVVAREVRHPRTGVFGPGIDGSGSVVYVEQGSVNVKDSVFENNEARWRGGALAVGSQAVVTVVDTAFVGNTAGGVTETLEPVSGGGGAIHVGGVGSRLVMERCRFEGNVAERGDGGAVAVVGALHTVSLGSHTSFVDNSASTGAGGGLSVVSAASCIVDAVSDTVFRGNAAGIGGSICATSAEVLPSDGSEISASYIKAGTGNRDVIVALGDNVVIGDTQAVYGGMVFLCGASLQLSANATFEGASRASIAGGRALFCTSKTEEDDIVFGANADTEGQMVEAGGYGTVSASPAVRIEFIDPLPASAPSGVAFGAGSVVAYDLFGQRVMDSRVNLVMDKSVRALSSIVLSGVAAAGVPSSGDGVYPVGVSAIATAEDWREQLNVGVEVGVYVAGSVVDETTLTGRSGPSAMGSVEVRACPFGMGRVSALTVPLTCAICEGGTYSVEESTEPCDSDPVCPPGVVAINGTCTPCPYGAVRTFLGGSGLNIGPCVCGQRFWTRAGVDNVECEACPVGAACEGGRSAPVALPGWFRDGGAYDGNFVRCPVQSSCLGNNTCAGEYVSSSYACRSCKEGHFRLSTDGSCAKCPKAAVGQFSMLFLVLGVLAVAATILSLVAVRSNAKKTLRYVDGGAGKGEGTGEGKEGKEFVPHAVGVCVVFGQVLGILGSSPMGWPSPVREMMQGSSAASTLDMSMFASSCVLDSYFTLQLIQLSLPLVFLGMVGVVIGVAQVWVRESGVALRVYRRVVFSLAPLAYIPMARASLDVFDCAALPNGKYYVESDLNVECFDGEWWRAVPFAGLGVVVYVLALPLMFFLVLRKHKDELDDPVVLAQYGSLYRKLRWEYWVHEVLQLVKRLMIVVSAVFLSQVEVWLFASLAGIFVSSALYHVRHRPYKRKSHNDLEIRLDVSLVSLVILGLLIWSDDLGGDVARMGVIVLTMSVMVGALVLILLAAVSELRERRAGRVGVVGGMSVLERGQEALVVRDVVRALPDLMDGRVREGLQRVVGGGGDDVEMWSWSGGEGEGEGEGEEEGLEGSWSY